MTGCDEHASARRWFACGSAAVGLVFYLYCLTHHCCIAGHFQHTDTIPVTRWDEVNDYLWPSFFAIAAVVAVRSDMRLRILFTLLTAWPVVSVFVLHMPPRGPSPTTVALLVVTVLSFLRKRPVGHDDERTPNQVSREG